MIEERIAVLLEVETQGATHVDVGVSDGGDAREMGLIELRPSEPLLSQLR